MPGALWGASTQYLVPMRSGGKGCRGSGLWRSCLFEGGGVEVETTVLLRGSLGLAVQCEEVFKGYY